MRLRVEVKPISELVAIPGHVGSQVDAGVPVQNSIVFKMSVPSGARSCWSYSLSRPTKLSGYHSNGGTSSFRKPKARS